MPQDLSVSSPVFLTNAEELVTRMERQGSPRALVMAAAARELVDTFRSWQRERPEDEVRIATIEKLFDLHRQAMDYLANQAPVSGRQPPVRQQSGVIPATNFEALDAALRDDDDLDVDDDMPSLQKKWFPRV